MYVFGGRNENKIFDDLWELNLENFYWRKIDGNG